MPVAPSAPSCALCRLLFPPSLCFWGESFNFLSPNELVFSIAFGDTSSDAWASSVAQAPPAVKQRPGHELAIERTEMAASEH